MSTRSLAKMWIHCLVGVSHCTQFCNNPHPESTLLEGHPCPCLLCLIDVRFCIREFSCSQNDRQTERMITLLDKPWRSNKSYMINSKIYILVHISITNYFILITIQHYIENSSHHNNEKLTNSKAYLMQHLL